MNARLPEIWIHSTLGEQLTRSDERVDPQSKPDELFFYVSLEHIESNTGRLLDVPLVKGTEIKSVKTIFHQGDILYGKLRPKLNKVYLAERDGICSTDIWVLKPSVTIDSYFASSYLRLPAIVKRLSQSAAGANLPRVEPSAFDSTLIPLPPFGEQQRIVQILRESDELRLLQGEAAEKSEWLLPTIFNKIFGDITANSSGLKLEPLGEQLIEPPQNGLYKHHSFYGDGTPIVRIGDFYVGRLNSESTFSRVQVTNQELSTYELEKGNVLINRVNSEEYVGKSALVEGLTKATVFESNMMRLRLNQEKLSARFLTGFLNTEYARKQFLRISKRAVNQASINQKDVMQLLVPIPSAEMLRDFDDAFNATLEIGLSQKYAVLSFSKLNQSILMDAFTGKLTKEWRTANDAELRAEAKERDSQLRKSAIALRADERAEAIEEIGISRIPAGRERYTENLSEKQRELLSLALKLSGYFDVMRIYNEQNGNVKLSRAAIEQSLALLAETGLLRRVRVKSYNSEDDREVFAPVIRMLKEEDLSKPTDVGEIDSELNPA